MGENNGAHDDGKHTIGENERSESGQTATWAWPGERQNKSNVRKSKTQIAKQNKNQARNSARL